ncbi:MAG: cytochrome c [Bacteroidia bacterium]|nr:cytochrome c [Bacteroidia bacterium]
MNFITRTYILPVLSFAALSLLVSCSKDPTSTGLEYAPQMYHSIPLEPYSQRDYNPFFADGKNAQAPVQGTIARGKIDYGYPYPNTPEGYEKAGAELKNPLPFTPENLEEGKRLYTLYCVHCHGEAGDGQGSIPAAGKFPPPPAYNGPLKNLPEGKMYHTITYGKNLMGSHASQLSPEERWKVIFYVKTLQNPDAATPSATSTVDSTAVGEKKEKTEKKDDKPKAEVKNATKDIKSTKKTK